MYSGRPEDKKNPDSANKTLAKKAIEGLVTVLFVFASWITGRYNLPGLNRKIVTDFCALHAISTQTQNAVYCTTIDVEVSDDDKKDAKTAGVTLIPARRKSTLDPRRHPPKLDWLVNHEIHFPNLGQLENVKYVVGHDSMTADAARDIRDSLFPEAELHLLKVDLPGVLVVFDKWDIEKYGLPEFHRNLLKDISSKIGKQVKVYTTVLDVEVGEPQREDAENAGITLIPGKRAEYVDPENDPISMLWLYNHRSYYRDLKDLKNIQFVIGYAPMTAFAAADIRKSLFPDAKLYQINAIHPDRHAKLTAAAQHKLERDMLRVAKESDAMVSIGPSMYDYFENAYRAIPDRTIPHIELLPKVGECFTKQTLKVKYNVQQHVILSYGEFDSCTDVVSDYDKIAESIGQVATVHKEVSGKQLKWNILGIPTESSNEVRQHLSGLLSCDFEVTQLKPISSINQILTHLQQCHICVTGLRHADFGFCGLEAIAAGLPTYVNRDSQLGSFITKYLSYHEDMCLINSAHQWHDKVMSSIRNTARAFESAKNLKSAYYECEEIDQSYARFAALFSEREEPSLDLTVTIEMNKEPWKQRLEELSKQLEVICRQEPVDQSAVDALKKTYHGISDALDQFQLILKRKADDVIEKEGEKVTRICREANVGVNQVTKITKGSLRMLLNFLSILGLYRFKSSVHTGRFADLYEPWLITDEMREIAAKVNLPLKLQVTYDKKKFDELDAFFIERDGRLSDSLRYLDGEGGFKFEKQPQSSPQVERQYLPLNSNNINTDIEENIPLGRRLILFKLDRVLQNQRLTTQCLPQILNIGRSAQLERITCDVLQIQVEITERIRHILLAKQEILSLLGIRAFLVTDGEEELNTEALQAQLEIHGTKVSGMTSTHRSLLARGLLLFDISHRKVCSCCDLCFLDLEETGTERDRQTQFLKDQLHKEREGKSSVEKHKELDRAIKDVKYLKDELDKTLKNRDDIEKQCEQAKQEAKLYKTQLDQVKEGKSLLDKQNQERLEELAKAEKVATEKAIEITSVKRKIQDLETNLAESSDLVTKLQAQLSDAENRATESDTIKDEFDKAQKEIAHLKELDKAEKIATDKAMEIISLKKEIHDLETKLAESSDLMTKMQAQLSDAETNHAESRDLVTKMQAKLSDAENRAIESDTLKDDFEKAQKEIAHLKDQLDQATKVVKQLDDQSVPVVVEKTQIQEELDRERKEKSLPRLQVKRRMIWRKKR
ncbi:cingulin-like [Ptychodera flava]|uniref:cingulin-like n=1 Tax=Ptychodera flava TaxID=63121 RepID=UPI00396A7444